MHKRRVCFANVSRAFHEYRGYEHASTPIQERIQPTNSKAIPEVSIYGLWEYDPGGTLTPVANVCNDIFMQFAGECSSYLDIIWLYYDCSTSKASRPDITDFQVTRVVPECYLMQTFIDFCSPCLPHPTPQFNIPHTVYLIVIIIW